MNTKQLLSKTLGTALFITAMLFGTSAVFAQVKIGTDPTVIDPANNLEVQASTTGRKISINKTTGKITIADGTQGAGRILTSDASGGASWQNSTTFIFYASQNNTLASPYTIPSGLASYSLGQKIPFTPVFGNGYNATTKAYSIPTAGYYRISAGVRCRGTGTRVEAEMVLQEGQFTPSDIPTNFSSTSSTFRAFSVIGYYPAGREVAFYLNNGSGTDITCATGYMAVESVIPPLP